MTGASLALATPAYGATVPQVENGWVQISTPGELEFVDDHQSTFLGSDIELTNNIALGGFNWIPFGQVSHPFTGIFDGQGYAITGLNVATTLDAYAGFFGEVDGTVKNVAVEGNVQGSGSAQLVGGLIGELYGGVVSHASMSGSVSGTSSTWVGGLVGESYGTVTDSHASASVSGGSANGGLVGGDYGTIADSYATGAVTGLKGYYNGGLVGSAWEGTVNDSYSTGDVQGGTTTDYQGGFIGYSEYTDISNSYAWGASTLPNGVGANAGFAGTAYAGSIQDSYALGHLSGGQTVSPFAFIFSPGSVQGAFYDTDNVTAANSVQGVQGESTAALKAEATFATQGWNFRKTWAINPELNDGFPYLQALVSSYSAPVPVNDSPEVPNAAALPLIGLASLGVWAAVARRRRRAIV